jgi:subtilase family serine protease
MSRLQFSVFYRAYFLEQSGGSFVKNLPSRAERDIGRDSPQPRFEEPALSNRKVIRSKGRTAHALRSSVLFEGLESRQLLSVTVPHHAGRHTVPEHTTATHDFALARNGKTARPAAAASPVGLSPSTVRHAYGIDNVSFNGVTGDGSGQTIAIVDAYNAPTIASDLSTFNNTFNLPSSTLTVVGQTGSQTSLPGLDPAPRGNSWAVETSLDVEWAHAVAPRANLLLVEANSSSLLDLFQAVDTARNASGVSVVSMSFGTSEFSDQGSYDYHFTTPAGHAGVTFVASSGDYGAYASPNSTTMSVQYPAASPNVLGVGGTRLALDSSGNYSTESAWGSGTSSNSGGGAGGGVSHYTSQPSYQTGVVTQTSTSRGVPDVAFLADPASGVAVVDSYDYGSATPWLQVGGTSLAAPMWAGVMATVNQGRALAGSATLDGASQTLPKLYSLASSNFHDVTTGNNGYAAGSGYDLVTGRGTPVVNLLAPALAGISSTTAPGTPTIGSFAANPSTVTTGSSFTLTAANVKETNGTISSVKFYEETNGTAGLQSTDTLIGAATQTSSGAWTLNVSSSGVSAGTYGLYAVATDASGVNSAASSAQVKITSATPANDNFASAQVLSGSTVAVTAGSVNATREAGEPYIQNNRGGHSIWFVWTATTSKKVSVNTHGSNFDTLLGVYAGNSVSTLTRIASNDDDIANSTTTSALTFNAVAGQTYRIAVDGYNGASGSVSLNIA